MLQKEPSSEKNTIENRGPRLLFAVICALTAGLAIPLVIVFLIKSPQLDEHLLIFGISYYKLVFILFLSSAIMVHASLFFIKAKPPIILFFFGLLIFCCFPFIFGLKKNLTLSQALVDIPFFANWPFYFKPGYVLIEFLIPLGVVAYLYLQIKKIFSKLPHNYAFLCVATYLALAAFLGLSGLAQAGLPTIGSAVERLFTVNFAQNFTDPVVQNELQIPVDPEKLKPAQASVVEFPMPSLPIPADEVKLDFPSAPQKTENFSEMFNRLSERLDGIQSQFDIMTQSMQKKEEDPWPTENKEAIVELRQEMQRLSDKIDTLSNTFSRMVPPVAAGGGISDKKIEIKLLDKQTAPLKKEALPSK